MAARPEYREIEHTADVGIELSAPDLQSALTSAAAAMFDVMCDLDSIEGGETLRLAVKAREGDLENLLVRWLTELLYVYESRNLLLSEFRIVKLRRGGIDAEVGGEAFDPKRHSVKTELKAPTYHDLMISEERGAWTVRVIFDT